MKIPFHFPRIKKIKEQYLLALDIGTQTVKALIFKKNKEKILIFGTSATSFEPFSIFDSWKFQEDLIKRAISKAVEEAELQAKVKKKLEGILLSLPANILKSRVLCQNLKRKNPKEKIQELEKAELIEEVFLSSQREISQRVFQESGILAKELFFLDFKILEIKIDGYEVPQILGLSGQDLEFKVILTFLLKSYSEIIEKIIKDLNLRILRIVQPAENLVSGLSNKEIGGLFIDIGGNISEVILLDRGKIQFFSEFPIGGQIFSQRLSETLGQTISEAEELKIRYSKKLLTEEVRQKIKEIFWQDTQFWFNSLKSELRKTLTLKIARLPSSIFLFGGSSLLPEIEEILTKGDWEDLLFFGQPKVKLLFPRDLKNILDQKRILDSPQNIPLLLLCYGI